MKPLITSTINSVDVSFSSFIPTSMEIFYLTKSKYDIYFYQSSQCSTKKSDTPVTLLNKKLNKCYTLPVPPAAGSFCSRLKNTDTSCKVIYKKFKLTKN